MNKQETTTTARERELAAALYEADTDPWDGVGASGLYLGAAQFWLRLGLTPEIVRGTRK